MPRQNISAVWDILLVSGDSECLPDGNTGTGLLRKSCCFWRDGDAGQDHCQSWICWHFRFYSDLFCRSDSLGDGVSLHCADLPLLHQEIHRET